MGQVVSSKYFTPPVMGKEPPTRILAFKWGLNDTKKGPFYLTPESAKSIIDKFNKDANPIVFDLEHLSLVDEAPLLNKRALAYGPSLETDDVGIWITNVTYTPEGYELVLSGKWGFTSPVFIPNLFKEVTKLTKMAFTNDPATRGARPLLLSMGDVMDQPMSAMPMNNELISKVKPLRDMQSQLGACMNTAQEAMNTHVDGPIKQMAMRMADSLPEWITAIGELLEQMDPEGLSKPQKEVEMPMAMPMPMGNKAQMMSTEKLSAPESEAVPAPSVLADSGEMSALMATLKDMTGEETLAKIQAKLMALKHNLSVTEEKLSESQVNEKLYLIDAAIAQGKIPPLEKEKFVSLSMDGLQTYLSSAKSRKDSFAELSERQGRLDVVDAQSAGLTSLAERVQKDVQMMFSRLKS